jgi:hypothetical protein
VDKGGHAKLFLSANSLIVFDEPANRKSTFHHRTERIKYLFQKVRPFFGPFMAITPNIVSRLVRQNGFIFELKHLDDLRKL